MKGQLSRKRLHGLGAKGSSNFGAVEPLFALCWGRLDLPRWRPRRRKADYKTKNLAGPVIPVPERLGQEHHCEFETSLDNILNFKLGGYRMRPCLTKQSKEEV